MTLSYEEIVHGESLRRASPDKRHEQICQRLHEHVTAAMGTLGGTRLLGARSVVRISPGSIIRPDLALVTSATGKLWLAAEVINSQDHCTDTVMKKSIYEETKLPRLWMIDPRYDNVEVYHSSPYGLVLKAMLARDQLLQEPLLPGFQVSVRTLFED